MELQASSRTRRGREGVRREGDNTPGLSGRVKVMTTWRASVHVYTHTCMDTCVHIQTQHTDVHEHVYLHMHARTHTAAPYQRYTTWSTRSVAGACNWLPSQQPLSTTSSPSCDADSSRNTGGVPLHSCRTPSRGPSYCCAVRRSPGTSSR